MHKPFNQVDFVADRFGGRPKLAEALEVGEHRVRYWADRGGGWIPQGFHLKALRAAKVRSVDLTPYDFIRHLIVVR